MLQLYACLKGQLFVPFPSPFCLHDQVARVIGLIDSTWSVNQVVFKSYPCLTLSRGSLVVGLLAVASLACNCLVLNVLNLCK